MRIRLATDRRTLFLAMFVAALLVLLPLRVVLGWAGLDDKGFAAREVRGSVWSGRLSEARFGDLALGDLNARVSPLALLIGRARVALESRNGDAKLSGTVELSRGRAGVIGTSGPIEPGSAFAPLPVTALNLDEVSVRFADGACEAAEGRVRAEISGTFLGAALPGAVSGTARCDGGALLLPLVSAAGTEGAALRLWADGRYRAELTLVPSDPAVATRLDTAGFVANGAARMLAIEGRF
ncbi:type II secretion system protein N [Sphingomonas sp. Mn802worker]|uniref:type II secretion system protein N n=1 Tax=Sphingomonas sp. Mn802worker TaxID=629773 RepID=UPI000380C77D|nr:type II secretion system protein N [Sphingomonas sp. Mn802worker]